MKGQINFYYAQVTGNGKTASFGSFDYNAKSAKGSILAQAQSVLGTDKLKNSRVKIDHRQNQQDFPEDWIR